MVKIVNQLIDTVLNLSFFEGFRSDIIRAIIGVLCIYQIAATHFAELPVIDSATFPIILGILTERATKFAKEHKN